MKVMDYNNAQNSFNNYYSKAAYTKDNNINSEVSFDIRKKARSLFETKIKEEKKTFTGTLAEKEKGKLYATATDKTEAKEDILLKDNEYNYKEVSSKIQRAKTSVSAGQAVISAKRKVLEIKRKMLNKDGDSKELQLALNHARKMEMVARKKKHHLELEELVVQTQKRDENEDKMSESIEDIRNSLVEFEEDKLSKAEDDILEQRSKLFDDFSEDLSGADTKDSLDTLAASEDMLSELNSMIAEFGEDELKELEEAMELLEDMEIIDPHMDKEELEDLKRKHRNSENKNIVKADMDYLKEFVKYNLEMTNSVSAISQGANIPELSGAFYDNSV